MKVDRIKISTSEDFLIFLHHIFLWNNLYISFQAKKKKLALRNLHN